MESDGGGLGGGSIPSLEALAGPLANLLDRIPLGVLLVDPLARVLLANAGARSILDRHDGLALGEKGRLVAGIGHETAALHRTIEAAAGDVAGRGRGGLLSLSRSAGRAPLEVLVAPARPAQAEEGHPAVVLFVSDPEERAATAEHLLTSLYALTPAEAHLTAILIQGKSVEQAADELGITTNTARTHLERVRGKTGCHRQGDLISLLLSGLALLRMDRRD